MKIRINDSGENVYEIINEHGDNLARILSATMEGQFIIEEMKFRLVLQSESKNKYLLEDNARNMVGVLRPKAWFGSSSFVTYYKNTYTLILKNSPITVIEVKNYKGKEICRVRFESEKA